MHIMMKPLFWMMGKLNPKMKVVPLQSIPMRSFELLEQYRGKSDAPEMRGSIIDLGGGGEGVIGQVLGRSVTAVDIRQDELEEAPDGPFKVVADARALPFENERFYCATAFYFLMYLKPEDYRAVIAEASRVLKTGGRLVIWDTVIPKAEVANEQLFVVPVQIELPKKKDFTAYGAKWATRELNPDMLCHIAAEYGLRVEANEINGQAFKLVLIKDTKLI